MTARAIALVTQDYQKAPSGAFFFAILRTCGISFTP